MENTKVTLEVENNFCNRFNRQLVIKCGNTEIKTHEFDARDDDAKRLALELMWAAQQLLVHHELEDE